MASEDIEPEPMTREEAKRILRRLELDAYSAVVTAFRAQGDINKSKKSILNELSNHLSISTERHRAEVRRVVNDDRLNAVAECMYGPGTSTEWSIEGRRLVSLMPRLVPQTVFTAKASAAANQAVENNQKLPIKTEIEVLPLPTKPKSLPPKHDRLVDNKDDSKVNQKTSTGSDHSNGTTKLDDKSKKKKKPNILYTKPSPLALNKTLTNPFKPSTTPSSLRPMIKSSPLKYSANYSVSKSSASAAISSPVKYSPKPIILQRSPTKSQPSLSRTPSIQLQSLNLSNVNTPLTSLSSLGSSKSESSLHLIQSPMIKVVSNALQANSNSSAASSVSALQNSSITQKIKFKTPLPKPKVKATKFKPMVPLQRPGLLSTSQNSDSIVLGTTSSGPVAPLSPSKPGIGTQGMSVKVVQVAKTTGGHGSTSLIGSSNKPVVVVSSNINKNPTQRVIAFSGVAQQVKVTTSNSQLSSAVTSSLPKGTLTSKSMPLATGFKMIAVTTVVSGTTQVKTVYIATPIMSLTKTVSQTTGSSITTPAAQSVKHIPSSLASNIKHIPSSLASNLQSVVARSMNTASFNSTGKGSQNALSTATIASSLATPSLAVGKASKIMPPAKGLGSLKTTLSGTAQSLKLFTAVSKSRPQLNTGSAIKNTPLLPSTSLLTSVVGQHSLQRVGNIQVKNTDSVNSQKHDKQHVVTVSHQVTPSVITNNFLNINAIGLNNNATLNNNGVPRSDLPLQTTLTLNVNNFDDVNTTLNLLNDENVIATEQITASATAETDDMAFLNAGEKFLEQLSAKMTATSPDSLNKNDSFMFPPSLSLELTNEALNQNQSIYELNRDIVDLDMAATKIDNRTIVNQLKPPAILTKDTNYLINQKTLGSHNIGLVTPKIPTQIMNNNIPLVNARFNLAANNLNVVNYSQNIQKTVNQMAPHTLSAGLSLSRPVFQQKADVAARTILNYPNITKVSAKVDGLNSNSDISQNTVGFISVGNSLENVLPNTGLHSIKLSSPNLSNKLHMSMPGSSKLNISPVLVNNMNSSTNSISVPSHINLNSESFTQICTIKSCSNNIVNFSSPINNLQTSVSSVNVNQSRHPVESNTVVVSSVGRVLNFIPDGLINSQMNDASETSNPKKRKLTETTISPSRTQASWIRGAANLLARVSRFRGTNKQKGEMNAASWFTKPVDPNDAPGYYRIIKNPTDFGKIKRKLEDGEYDNYPSFYEDMMLIKRNCYTYNPVGHIARKDCDDVFSFFQGEYQKLLERWEKHHVSPQKKIKISLEENGSSS